MRPPVRYEPRTIEFEESHQIDPIIEKLASKGTEVLVWQFVPDGKLLRSAKFVEYNQTKKVTKLVCAVEGEDFTEFSADRKLHFGTLELRLTGCAKIVFVEGKHIIFHQAYYIKKEKIFAIPMVEVTEPYEINFRKASNETRVTLLYVNNKEVGFILPKTAQKNFVIGDKVLIKSLFTADFEEPLDSVVKAADDTKDAPDGKAVKIVLSITSDFELKGGHWP